MSEHKSITPIASTVASAIANLKKSIDAMPPEVKAKRQADEADFARRRKESRLDDLLAASGAPKRQLDNVNLDRSGEWGKAESKVLTKLGKGFFIALIGTRGCGKTQIGVEAVRATIEIGRRARYTTAMQFFMEIKATYDSAHRCEKDVLDEFTRPALLVLDEIGQRSESEWENRLLFELLNRRYNAMKDTLIISNQSAEDFRESIGPSLLSRMTETGGIIRCQWPSYRKAQ